jgi:LPXTG-motif cell wall-anchored protein
MHMSRSLAATLLTLIAAGFGVVGAATPAQADDPYAYWLYYSVEDGAYVYQDVGASDFVPEDGSIEAYRYASALFPPAQQPRADLADVTFDAVCGDTEAADGEKQVAVLIDYGIDGDAPNGDAEAPDPVAECAVVPVDATGLQTLQSVADVRTDKTNGVCGIDAYPSGGDCFALADEESAPDGEPVEFAIAGDEAADDDEDDSNWLLLAGVGALVVVIGAGGVVLARRNRSA